MKLMGLMTALEEIPVLNSMLIHLSLALIHMKPIAFWSHLDVTVAQQANPADNGAVWVWGLQFG